VSISAKIYSRSRFPARLWWAIEAPAPRIRRLSCEQTTSLRPAEGQQDLPAEIRQLLVDALESHVWVWMRESVVSG
jgi:hypothetical protein